MKRFVDCLVALSEENPDLTLSLVPFIKHLLLKNAVPQDSDLIETLILRLLDQTMSDQQRLQQASQMQNMVVDLLKVLPGIPLDAILAKAKECPL